jgi:putative iron-only hydrogenase system regulator
MGNNLTVIGLMVNDRSDSAPKVQEIITRHGTDILCRMGVPTQDKENGLITLVMDGPDASIQGLLNDLQATRDVTVRTMSF